MEAPLSFIIPGEPRPKKRPKVYRWSTVNPSKKDEDRVAKLFRELPNCLDSPLAGQIRVEFKFFKNPPKGTPQWKLPLMERGYFRPNKSPDLDNYVKFILDALNGILWEDDRFIIEIHSSKYYTVGEPRTEIKIDQIPFPNNRKEA
ncbi:MAG: RusA family crossover junction endodeoxyribonuclease, partial [Candidatus Kariarchaeaceae archaeon]